MSAAKRRVIHRCAMGTLWERLLGRGLDARAHEGSARLQKSGVTIGGDLGKAEQFVSIGPGAGSAFEGQWPSALWLLPPHWPSGARKPSDSRYTSATSFRQLPA